MSAHTPHELHEAFPHHAEAIHRLKLSDPHFARLAEQHHDINRAIHRAESEIEPASDAHLEDLKKQRLQLLDDIAAILDQAQAGMGSA